MRLVMAVAAAVTLAFGMSAQGTLIDSFDTYQTQTANSGNPSDSSEISGAGILGSYREMEALWTAGPNDVQTTADAGGSGVFNFSLGADTDGKAYLTWDGAGDAGLGGYDLTDGGTQDRIRVALLFDDLPADCRIAVLDTSGGFSYGDLRFPGGVFTETYFDVLYSDFLHLGSPADFTDIDLVTVAIQCDYPATDIQMDFVETAIPGPAALSLLGLGGLLVTRRRR